MPYYKETTNMPQRHCIFCKQELSPWEHWVPENGPNYYEGRETLIYKCESCHSQQDFNTEGERTFYTFRVGRYCLKFCPNSDFYPFSIDDWIIDPVGGPDRVLSLNYLPTHLTPQNTTEERIKTLILFS